MAIYSTAGSLRPPEAQQGFLLLRTQCPGPLKPRTQPEGPCHWIKTPTGNSSLRPLWMSHVSWNTSLCPGALVSMTFPACPLVLLQIKRGDHCGNSERMKSPVKVPGNKPCLALQSFSPSLHPCSGGTCILILLSSVAPGRHPCLPLTVLVLQPGSPAPLGWGLVTAGSTLSACLRLHTVAMAWLRSG